MSSTQSTSLLISKLVDLLETAGRELLGKSGEATSLRRVQKFLWDWEDNPADDVNIRFLVFFSNTFIEKVFYNLTGDVPYIEGVMESIHTKFNRELGQILCAVSAHLQAGRYTELHICYVKMGVIYLDAVDALNKAL